MLKDRGIDSAYNRPNPSIDKGTIRKRLIEFIEKTLYIFQNEFKGNIKTSEEILNEKLVITLAFHSKQLPFIFQQEAIQKQSKGQNRKVDIGVFLNNIDDPFFTIEAKRLPTLPKYREREYVVGNDKAKLSGGIERFKNNVHGVDLSESALVAYVQQGSFQDWQNKINDWIDQLVKTNNSKLSWSSNDLLVNTCKFKDNRISKFTSNNKKVNNSDIKLFHYFINMMN